MAYQVAWLKTNQQKGVEEYYTLTDEAEEHLWERLTKDAERGAESDVREPR
jgi:hypothetical protein